MSEKNGQTRYIEALKGSRRTLVLIVAFFVLALFYRHGRDNISPEDSYSMNIHTEVFGFGISVVITVFVIDELNRRRDKERREQDTKEQLLRDAVSPNPDDARKAFFDMWKRGLVQGEHGILRGANLYGARPGEVTLSGARMDGAIMRWSDFSKSEFDGAILDNACLKSADLEWASLCNASLKNADLENADLSHATLIGADLTGANLLGTKIYRNNLYNHAAEMPDIPDTEKPQAKLPDGKPMNANTDLAYFTDENYPGGVWRSKDPESPAFRGHYEERLAFIQRMSENRPSNFPPLPSPNPRAGGDAG
ncbi:MAG: pentapeptide repeat-containing protein [Anaerolineaceae bacterium]|nr:pentapeptide repeat-containing protein [Anaerolineaceae bacterium]MDE0329087.1 pentapeptide repeat-containing protein [Anaerolineaceae bacterium]